MSENESRHLRRAIATLAECSDDDVSWIMGTLTPSQRARVAALADADVIETIAPDDADRRMGVFLDGLASPLASRFRLALDLEGGEGNLSLRTRETLSAALKVMAAKLPAMGAPVSAPRGWRALLDRTVRGYRS